MNSDFFQLETVRKSIEKLPLSHRGAFAASICERMLPLYNVFAQQEGWGDPISLRKGLNEVWEFLQGKHLDEQEILQIVKSCEDAAPHSDYVTQSRLDSEAQNVCSAICATLEFCLYQESQFIFEVLEFVRDTIDGFLTSRKEDVDPNWPEISLEEQNFYISNHPLALQEITKQHEDLQRLKEAKTLDNELLEWLRTSYNNEGKSLIDLS